MLFVIFSLLPTSPPENPNVRKPNIVKRSKHFEYNDKSNTEKHTHTHSDGVMGNSARDEEKKEGAWNTFFT